MRSGSDPAFLNPVSFETYGISDNDEIKNSIMKSSLVDNEPTAKSHYESATVADMLKELDMTTPPLDTTLPVELATKYTSLPTASQSTPRMQHKAQKPTTFSEPIKEDRSVSSFKNFLTMSTSASNSSDSAQNLKNNPRPSFSNPKDESQSLNYDEDLDLEAEGTPSDVTILDGVEGTSETVDPKRGFVDIVTRFLTIVESQHLLGENCTAGTDLNLGEGVVDQYAQERFRVEAEVAVNRANMLTRLWKYAAPEVMSSEYLLHASVFSMVEFDEDIFAAGNCYDKYQYKDYWLFCPYAYRLPEGPILVKDLAVEYKYLSNTSEWFYIARKNAENVIRNYSQFSRGESHYTYTQRLLHDFCAGREGFYLFNDDMPADYVVFNYSKFA
jgi:hypothetical protein